MSTTTPSPPAPRPRLEVLREPLTYDRRSAPWTSWIVDCWNARFDDPAAVARLDRHAQEIQVEMRDREAAIERRASDIPAEWERRAIDLTSGHGGYGTPPLWLIDEVATAPRPMRVLASDLTPTYPCPEGVATVNVPLLSGGTVEQVTPPGTAVPGPNAWADAATSSQIVTISGELDVPIQMIEQGGRAGASFDAVVFKDLLSAYDSELETQMLVGAGGTGPYAELTGLLTLASTGSVTYTSSSPTATGAYPLIGQMLGLVADSRKARPEAILMRFGRWVWFTTSEDSESRPLGVPDAHNPPASTPPGVADPVGSLINVNAYSTEAIPTTLGTAGNQDVVIALRPSDTILFEGTPRANVFTEVLSGELGGRIQLRNYVAYLPGRYPSSIAVLGGTGLSQPTNE